ncbi:hypothetical protein PAL_GLEAN10008089 [Pteropus alecto]|uniref:Uncharacterized protein n=1 Tax=Pteropus alecto TaxID=9402 RepID=L5K050_PTEAL|nr:hypothetical protein PAL_GLEAN10008089 [Pteropus alecto]
MGRKVRAPSRVCASRACTSLLSVHESTFWDGVEENGALDALIPRTPMAAPAGTSQVAPHSAFRPPGLGGGRSSPPGTPEHTRSHCSRSSSPLSGTAALVWLRAYCRCPLQDQDGGPRAGHRTEEPGAPVEGPTRAPVWTGSCLCRRRGSPKPGCVTVGPPSATCGVGPGQPSLPVGPPPAKQDGRSAACTAAPAGQQNAVRTSLPEAGGAQVEMVTGAPAVRLQTAVEPGPEQDAHS